MFLIEVYRYVNEVKKHLGLIHDREPYLLGNTYSNIDEAYEKLIEAGYQWDYFAWEDVHEGVSARKLYKDRQIHVRVFYGGEVRVHDEYNYEIEPLKHYHSESLTTPSQEEIDIIKKALDIS